MANFKLFSLCAKYRFLWLDNLQQKQIAGMSRLVKFSYELNWLDNEEDLQRQEVKADKFWQLASKIGVNTSNIVVKDF